MADSPGKTLYLLRHAKAQKAVPNQDDRARALIERGRGAAGQLAVWFTEHRVHPAVVLCSPATRARETFDIVRPALGEPRIVFEERLYGASPQYLLGLIAKLPSEDATALIVGHNPGLEELALQLGGHGSTRLLARMGEKFPTCALAVLVAPVRHWSGFAGASRIEDFIRPADLG